MGKFSLSRQTAGTGAACALGSIILFLILFTLLGPIGQGPGKTSVGEYLAYFFDGGIFVLTILGIMRWKRPFFRGLLFVFGPIILLELIWVILIYWCFGRW